MSMFIVYQTLCGYKIISSLLSIIIMGEDTVQVHTGPRQLGRIQCKYFHFFSLLFLILTWLIYRDKINSFFPFFSSGNPIRMLIILRNELLLWSFSHTGPYTTPPQAMTFLPFSMQIPEDDTVTPCFRQTNLETGEEEGAFGISRQNETQTQMRSHGRPRNKRSLGKSRSLAQNTEMGI